MSERIEIGCAGHFIGSADCQWTRHTRVGAYRVSSVGEYRPRSERTTLGAGDSDYFETMVFKARDSEDPTDNDGCGCGEIEDWSELECERYATAGEAQAGHEAMVEKYQKAPQ